MFQITCFAGSSGDMAPSGFTALTLFGGAELRRPTLASLLLDHKARRSHVPTRWESVWRSDDNLVITLFGGTSIVARTVAEEFAAMTSVLRSGALSPDECRIFLDEAPELGRRQGLCRTLTLFGGCAVSYPDPRAERQAVEAGERSGEISRVARPDVEAILDSPPESRVRLVGTLALGHA